jgi:hypothetical protein
MLLAVFAASRSLPVTHSSFSLHNTTPHSNTGATQHDNKGGEDQEEGQEAEASKGT